MENISENVNNSKKKESYKWCFVPECTNTSIKTPNKVFLTVPRDIKRRKMWLKMARRDDVANPPTSCLFCCEDHFNLENDLENYIQLKLMNWQGKKIIKKGIVPHIFDCQRNRNTKRSTAPRSFKVKRQKRQLVDEILRIDSKSSQLQNTPLTLESEEVEDKTPLSNSEKNIEDQPSTSSSNDGSTQTHIYCKLMNVKIKEENFNDGYEEMLLTDTECQVKVEENDEDFSRNDTFSDELQPQKILNEYELYGEYVTQELKILKSEESSKVAKKTNGKQKETSTQRKRRLEKARQKYREKQANMSEEKRATYLERKRVLKAQAIDKETPLERERRLEQMRQYRSQSKDTRTLFERTQRLQYIKRENSQESSVLNDQIETFKAAIHMNNFNSFMNVKIKEENFNDGYEEMLLTDTECQVKVEENDEDFRKNDNNQIKIKNEQNASSFSNTCKDELQTQKTLNEYELFGKYVAKELKILKSEESRISLKNKILQIIIEITEEENKITNTNKSKNFKY